MAIRHIGKFGLAGFLALSSLGGVALAHGGGFGGFGGKAPPEVLAKYDANKDGTLDENERAAAKQDFIKQYDANGNGQLDPEERVKVREARAAERFKKLDTNGDGQLSLSEFQAGMKEMHGRHGFRGQR